MREWQGDRNGRMQDELPNASACSIRDDAPNGHVQEWTGPGGRCPPSARIGCADGCGKALRQVAAALSCWPQRRILAALRATGGILDACAARVDDEDG